MYTIKNKKKNEEYLIKIIVIGESNIGKTSLTNYYIKRTPVDIIQNNSPTIGIEFFSKIINIDNIPIKLHIWDTAGQEKFKSITKAYYREAIGALLCFSITNKHSFLSIPSYINDIREYCDYNVQLIIVGTFNDECDKREVTEKEITKFCEAYDLIYVEISSKTGHNIDKLFKLLIDKILIKHKNGLINIKRSYDLVTIPDNNKNCCNIS